MPNPPSSEQRPNSFSVKLASVDRLYLESEQKKRGPEVVQADILREMVEAFRTLFGLPHFMANLVRADMAAQGLGEREYIQELLAKRAMELSQQPAEPPATPAAPRKPR